MSKRTRRKVNPSKREPKKKRSSPVSSQKIRAEPLQRDDPLGAILRGILYLRMHVPGRVS